MSKLTTFIEVQTKFEQRLEHNDRKNNGVFFTNEVKIIDLILENIEFHESILNKKILEPSCGNGIFLIYLIIKVSLKINSAKKIKNFIEKNIYFNDISEENIEATKKNIKKIYFILFEEEYNGGFNDFLLDFTIKKNFEKHFSSFDYIIGNPPYVALYGRRDQKKNEEQREYYLKNFDQFPKSLQNGKINLVMIFIEQSINLLKSGGVLSFIIDVSFFETAYLYLRKYLLENTQIINIIYDIAVFKDVASGQVILSVKKGYKEKNKIEIISYHNENKNFTAIQDNWNNEKDNFKFRIEEYCDTGNYILEKIFSKKDKTLKELYPAKNLRTGTMLLNMENEFIVETGKTYSKKEIKNYPYYKGSKSIKNKFAKPISLFDFYFDETKKEQINSKLQKELEEQGIKNKKRLGFGEVIVYDNPKVYIRQSAKEIIATYDENKSCCNNSLYIFTLRNNKKESLIFLKFLTGFLNSKIITFIAQKRRIIRYDKGKQPQIKISDLYELNIPQHEKIILEISSLVDRYIKTNNPNHLKAIDDLIITYYELTKEEVKYIEDFIEDYLL